MTPAQRCVLDAIVVRVKRDGHAPTVREIAADVWLASTNGIFEKLTALERDGRIARGKHRARAVTVLRQPA